MLNLRPIDLQGFTGSINLWKDNLLGWNYTDGIKFIRENGADWLFIRAAFNVWSLLNRVETPGFLAISLKRDRSRTVTLSIQDGDENIIHTERLSMTDFPLEEWPNREFSIFWADNTFYLPSEH